MEETYGSTDHSTNAMIIPARRIRDNGLPVPQRRDAVNDAGIDLYLDLTPVKEVTNPASYTANIIRGGVRVHGADKLADVALELVEDTIVWVRTGWALDIPAGAFAHVKGRSGLAFKHGITAWHVGTDDARYQGEVLVALWNASSAPYTFKHGDRIAQLVVGFTPSPATVQEVMAFEPSPRGEKGFGSSGR